MATTSKVKHSLGRPGGQKEMLARRASIRNQSKQRQETGTRRPAQLAVYPIGFVLTFGSPSFSPLTSAKTSGTCFTHLSLFTKALMEKSCENG